MRRFDTRFHYPPQTTEDTSLAKVLVLYYSSYGHIEAMAQAFADGAQSAGASVDIKRVPETVPQEVAKTAQFKLEQAAPIAMIDELADYDAIAFGAPTRFGRISSQMASFLDQAGGLWMRGALNGKLGGGLHLNGIPTWRAGDDAHLPHHQHAPLRAHYRRIAL